MNQGIHINCQDPNNFSYVSLIEKGFTGKNISPHKFSCEGDCLSKLCIPICKENFLLAQKRFCIVEINVQPIPLSRFYLQKG